VSSSDAAIDVRAATPPDADAIWGILEPIFRRGDTYAVDHDISRDDALGWWLRPAHDVFVAVDGGEVVGTYHLVANHDGRGAHVANAGYAVAASAQGRGVGRLLCEHSLGYARERGFRAMQFNFVVSTNESAIRLWQAMGFDVVGRLPMAFDHPELGLVDALVMHRHLQA
jgi:ribosomal protein S18 acetylase RimI-like enzyme